MYAFYLQLNHSNVSNDLVTSLPLFRLGVALGQCQFAQHAVPKYSNIGVNRNHIKALLGTTKRIITTGTYDMSEMRLLFRVTKLTEDSSLLSCRPRRVQDTLDSSFMLFATVGDTHLLGEIEWSYHR